MGAAFSPDGSRFYYGSADEGEILELGRRVGRRHRRFRLDDATYRDSFAGDLALSRDGRRIFVVDQFNYRMAASTSRPARSRAACASAAIRSRSRSARRRNGVGLERRHVRVSARARCHQSPRARPGGFLSRSTASPRARRATASRDGTRIPGLGDPNAPEAMSVFGVNLATDA
jgi:hypothetical protein